MEFIIGLVLRALEIGVVAVLVVDAGVMGGVGRSAPDVDLVQFVQGDGGLGLGVDLEHGLGEMAAHAGNISGPGIVARSHGSGGAGEAKGDDGAGDQGVAPGSFGESHCFLLVVNASRWWFVPASDS